MQDFEAKPDLLADSATLPKRPAWQQQAKRAIDILGAALALLLLSPLLAAIACSIYFLNGRPVFYRWHVVGKHGVPFTSWKFRTMVRDADQRKRNLQDFNEMQGPVFKLRNDPRIIPLGRILRRYSLDELPQFWSVLKGDMTLVGPRPPLVTEYERFSAWHKKKLSVVPGVTCLWQIGGRNDITNFDDWVRMDLQYIEHWSVLGDFKIMLRTVRAVLGGRGAY